MEHPMNVAAAFDADCFEQLYNASDTGMDGRHQAADAVISAAIARAHHR